MPTLKRRLNLTLPKEIDDSLRFLADRDDVPQASKAVDLLKIALEIEEDFYFNAVAEKRDIKKARFLSHKDVWK